MRPEFKASRSHYDESRFSKSSCCRNSIATVCSYLANTLGAAAAGGKRAGAVSRRVGRYCERKGEAIHFTRRKKWIARSLRFPSNWNVKSAGES